MPSCSYFFVLLVGGLLLSGCSTGSQSSARTGATQLTRSERNRENSTEAVQRHKGQVRYAPAVRYDDDSPEAMERRTEAHARYATAVSYDWNEEPEEAAAEYYKAALADPTNESLVLEVSQRLVQLKQNDKAVEVLSNATAVAKASGILFAQLGRVYSLLGKRDLAVEANRMAIKKMPRAMLGYRNLAQIHFQNSQYEEGLKVLDQAAKQSNADANYLIELGELYTGFIRAGASPTAKERALETYNRAAKLNPTNAFLIQKLADGFAVVGESERAAELYLRLLERIPSWPGLREKLAELYLRQQDRKKAAEQLEAVIRNNPTHLQAYYLLGNIAFEDKNPKQAAEYFTKAMLLNPNFEPVYYDLAGAQINLNKPYEALATLDKARTKFQQGFVGEFYTAMAYNRLKDYTNVLKHLTAAEVIARATETNRLNHGFYYQLGAACERNQKYEEAEKHFRKCLELSPDSSEAMNYLGYMWAERGTNLTEAHDLIEKAVKSEPKNPAYLDSLGWVLFKLNKPKEALPWLLKSIEHSEEPDATLYDHLGDIYSALQQPEKACEAWRKALSVEPSEQIQKKLGATTTSERSPR